MLGTSTRRQTTRPIRRSSALRERRGTGEADDVGVDDKDGVEIVAIWWLAVDAGIFYAKCS